jgi:predicted ester cyclase
MPVVDNKQAVRRFYQEVINGRNLDVLDELLIPDGVDHAFGSQNPEQAKQFFGMVDQAFPDLHAEVHDVIAEGELVAARVTYTGTHQGEFVGIPATGRKTTTSGVARTRHARLTVASRARPPLSWVGHQRSGAAAAAWLWSSRCRLTTCSGPGTGGQECVLGPLCAG